MRCEYAKNGKRCNAKTLTGDRYCFMHSQNPDVKEKRKKALSQGGKNAHKEYPLIKDTIMVKNNRDVIDLINKLVREVRVDEISVKKANCVGYLLNISLKALDSELEERIKNLENVLSKRK